MGKWEKVRLGDVCEVLDSMRVPVTASNRKAGIYPYYGANGIQDYVDEYIFDDELVLLAEDGGNFGSKTRPIAYRVSGKCWVNNHAHVLKPKDMLNIDYLCYSIMFYDVTKIISGTTRAKLNQSAMRKMTIPLPPLEIQQKIAAILDTAAALLKLRQQQLAELEALIQSVFYQMFGDPVRNEKGWDCVKLEKIAEIVSGITKGRKIKDQVLIDVPYMRVANVKDGHIDLSEIKTIEATEIEIQRYSLQYEDILMTEGGDPDKLGRGAIWRENLENCIHQNHLFRVRVNKENLVPQYFAEYVKQQRVKQYFLRCAKQTTGIASINMGQLKLLPVLIPPIELQTQFAAIVQKIDQQKALVQQSIDETQTLFDSLMSQYFD